MHSAYANLNREEALALAELGLLANKLDTITRLLSAELQNLTCLNRSMDSICAIAGIFGQCPS